MAHGDILAAHPIGSNGSVTVFDLGDHVSIGVETVSRLSYLDVSKYVLPTLLVALAEADLTVSRQG